MEQTTETYDSAKVESVKHFLESRIGKTNPKTGESLARYYEIFVDNLKVVERTNDVEEFDNYTDFLRDGTKEIRVLIYTHSALAPKLTSKHVFRLQPEEPKKEPGLSGTDIEIRITERLTAERQKWELDQLRKDLEATKKDSSLSGVEFETKIDERIAGVKQQWELDQLKKELSETQKSLEEAEDYIEDLEKQAEILKGKKGLEDVKTSEAIGMVLEGIARRNTGLIRKLPIPMAKGLAGVIDEDNERRSKEDEDAPDAATETSFKEKEPEQNPLSEQMKQRISIIQKMERAFDQQEINTVMQIINTLSNNKDNIKVVADLLNIKK
jgi:hypothetical protein